MLYTTPICGLLHYTLTVQPVAYPVHKAATKGFSTTSAHLGHGHAAPHLGHRPLQPARHLPSLQQTRPHDGGVGKP